MSMTNYIKRSYCGIMAQVLPVRWRLALIVTLLLEGVLALCLYRKGAMPMVSWSDLIQLIIALVALASLFYMIGKRK